MESSLEADLAARRVYVAFRCSHDATFSLRPAPAVLYCLDIFWTDGQNHQMEAVRAMPMVKGGMFVLSQNAALTFGPLRLLIKYGWMNGWMNV